MLPVAASSSGPVCHQVQQLHLCLASSRSTSLGSRCPQSTLGRSGPICLPTSSYLGQSGGKVAGPPVQQTHTDCTRVVQHALVLGPGNHVQSDPTVCTFCLTFDSATQPDPSQEPGKSESTCLAPRAPATKEAGLPWGSGSSNWGSSRGSTRSVYEAKWTICFTSGTSVIRWTSGYHL